MVDPTVHCPLVTPFDGDAVDAAALASLVGTLSDAGIDGFVPCGTTGEFTSLTHAERRTVVETVAEAADDGWVLAGVADTTVAGVRDGLEHAASVGADAALVTLPYYHGANAPRGEVEFVEAVAQDAPLPIYLYNLPAYVGREIDPEVAAAAADLDPVVGMKDSSDDLSYLRRIDRYTPGSFALYQGIDTLYVPSCLVGATGGIHAVSNALPEAFVAVRDALAAGDVDRATSLAGRTIEPVFEQLSEHGFASATKVAAAARGFLDDASVRPPLTELDPDARAAVEAAVDDALTAL